MSLLEISSLTVDIHGKRVLSDVSLDIAPGEIVALTGESGSGKSMTALAIMGLLPEGANQAGTINLDGTDLAAADEATLCAIRGNDIGMVFQEPMTALNPLMTIGDQVAETVMVHGRAGRAEARRIARQTLDRVGLPAAEFPLSRYPHELSGGQRQRVVIAMAIALRPKLLIADEPTTALDVTTQARILDLLRELVADFGMGMLLITHDLAVVADVAHRIAVMQTGVIVEAGETRALFSAMSHPYTRLLFEASRHRVDLPPRPDTPGPALLEVEDAVREYPVASPLPFVRARPFRAVDGVSLRLADGERAGLVGESGCGKSTLTRAILGLETLQGGQIRLGGQPVMIGHRPNPTVRRGLSVVFQDPFGSFNPRHRVERLIAEPFHLLDDPPRGAERRAAIGRALSDVGLSPSDAGKYIHEFSGGQRQRIAIARALIIRPKLIIFDEAVSALDVSVRAQILDLLAMLTREYGLTYLFISHDLTVVRSVTEYVYVMRAGQIVEHGPTESVFAAPRHPYTRQLIDAAPVLPAVAAE